MLLKTIIVVPYVEGNINVSGVNMVSKIRPLHDHVVVEPIEEIVSLGGIVIPDNADKERPVRGLVYAVGHGKIVDGKLSPVDLTVGDTVLFSKYSGTEIKLDGKSYLVMKESDILAVVTE